MTDTNTSAVMNEKIDKELEKYANRKDLISPNLICYCIRMSIYSENTEKLKFFILYFCANRSLYDIEDTDRFISILYNDYKIIDFIAKNQKLCNFFNENDYFLTSYDDKMLKIIKKYRYDYISKNEYIRCFLEKFNLLINQLDLC